MAKNVELPGPGTFNVPALSIENVVSGNWYFGTDCLECNTRLAILEDDSGGQIETKFIGEGHIRTACPHCGADRMYSSDQILQYQHP